VSCREENRKWQLFTKKSKMTIIHRFSPSAQPCFAVALFISTWFYIAGITESMNAVFMASITGDTAINPAAPPAVKSRPLNVVRDLKAATGDDAASVVCKS
jgi:hypothetical protein